MKGNAKQCQGNVRERMQIPRGTQGNAAECQGTYGSGCKVQGNAGEYMGMPGKLWECKLPGECRECRVMPGEGMVMSV